MLAKWAQYANMDKIIRAACEVGGLSYVSFIGRGKSLQKNVLRGVVCVISRDTLIHPTVAALMMCRTRANVINVARKYHHYLQAKDKITCEYYQKVKDKIEKQ